MTATPPYPLGFACGSSWQAECVHHRQIQPERLPAGSRSRSWNRRSRRTRRNSRSVKRSSRKAANNARKSRPDLLRSRSWDIGVESGPWRSHPTDARWRPPAVTARSGSGMRGVDRTGSCSGDWRGSQCIRTTPPRRPRIQFKGAARPSSSAARRREPSFIDIPFRRPIWSKLGLNTPLSFRPLPWILRHYLARK
jgi:hypothetical protein